MKKDIRNYRQIFHPPILLTRAPWYAIWWFNIQKAVGWIWLKRKMGRPDPWDESL